jgi:hypothetical protein
MQKVAPKRCFLFSAIPAARQSRVYFYASNAARAGITQFWIGCVEASQSAYPLFEPASIP